LDSAAARDEIGDGSDDSRNSETRKALVSPR